MTLVTGDRVTHTDHGAVAVHRGPGREQVAFLTQRFDGHQFVIPSDALPLIAAGELDRRLFDVTLLRESGYHDQRADLPLIVTADTVAGAEAGLPEAGATVVRDLAAVDGVAVEVDKAELVTFWEEITDGADPAARTLAPEVSAVWLDGLRQPLLEESVPQVGAPAAWAEGLDGTGVTVAVLDSGIDATHPDLADQVVGQENFTEGTEDDRDIVGHGTHVASTVAGTGAASGGRFQGVAPGADLLDGKICVEFGCADSWILAGMQWAAEQGAQVVNMSIGGPPFEDDPVVAAVEQLTAEFGVLFVIAAGNSGDAPETVDAPGIAESALTVGAVDKDDVIADFSGRGPTLAGTIKPDLTAPGVAIVAANSADGFLGDPGEAYTTLSGTSMATPHVAGAAAILAQQHPEWTPEQLKATLMGAAVPHPDLDPYAQGAGRLDVARAIGQTVTTDPPSVSFDRTLWPHDDDAPQTHGVTYHNSGTEDVTLDLGLTTTGPDGEPAPAGFFSVSDTSVTVPAGGSAEVVLTADTSVGDLDGRFAGYLTATGPDDLVVTTSFGVDREVESYDVTFAHTDRDGAPTGDYETLLVGGDPPRLRVVYGEPEVTVRLPVGDYTLGTFMYGDIDSDQPDSVLLGQPVLTVTGEQTVAVDGRLAEPVALGVTDPAAVPFGAQTDFIYDNGEFGIGFGASADAGHLYTGQLGPSEPVPGALSIVAGSLAVPPSDGDLAASRTVYHLAWVVEDRFVTGLDRTAQPDELARVTADYGQQVAGSQAFVNPIPLHPEHGGFGGGPLMPLPLKRTEFYTTGGPLQWLTLFDEVLVTDESLEPVILLDGVPTTYEAGERYRQQWNYGVFGPALTSVFSGVLRIGDELAVQPELYADGAGHWGWTPSTGTITVFRDGEQILAEPSSEFGLVAVPPEPARYRVEVEAERDSSGPLSRHTDVAWEFESGHVDQETLVQLPVSVVRFSPKLAPDNTAPAGRPFLVPVTVQPAPASDAGAVRNLAVEVSYDDGQTWRRAPVLGGKVLLWHPRGEGFVSLRATATDRAGNTVEQTVIRAYEIG